MNKQEARRRAAANSLSVAELRTMIAARRGAGGMSRVNPAIPLEQVPDIYERALGGRDADEVPKGMRYDVFKKKDKPSRDALLIANILRDCEARP